MVDSEGPMDDDPPPPARPFVPMLVLAAAFGMLLALLSRAGDDVAKDGSNPDVLVATAAAGALARRRDSD